MAETIQNNQATLPVANNGSWPKARIQLWIGLAFLGLVFLTVFLIAPQVQQKLDHQTRERLEQAGINPASLQFSWNYRDLTVEGYLPDNVSHQQFATIVRGDDGSGTSLFAKGIRHLQLNIDEAAFITPTEEQVAVVVNSDGLVATIEGVVQDDNQRGVLVAALVESGINDIYDNLDVSGGLATNLMSEKVSLLAHILKETGPTQSSRSEIRMTEANLYYRITAVDKRSAHIIEKAAAIKIDDFRITGGVDVPGAQSLDVIAQADGNRITLSGSVGSEAHRKRLLFAAGEAVGGPNVVDELQITGSPYGNSESMTQIDGVAAVISRFATGITGDVSLKGSDLVVNAIAGSEPVRDYLLVSTATARSTGLSVTENIAVNLPVEASQALQRELDKLIIEVRDSVVFASGDSELTPSAKQTLNKVAARINEHDGLLVEIEGHTDNVGRAIVNEQLSQSRASAVRNYLSQNTKGGGSQLIAVGYGHRRPIDSNDTAEGRQANRRVHFTVLKQPENPG